MTKRGRTKSVEKRRLILTAAVETFIERGFTGASMDEIAERAGVSKQTVYSHFQAKETLFKAAIEQKCEDFGLTETFFAEPRPIRDTLTELAHHFLSLLLSPEPLAVMRLCIAEAESHPEVAQLFFNTGPEQLTLMVSEYLHRVSESGQLQIAEPRFAAVQFLHMVRGEAHFRATLNLPGWTDKEIDDYIESCVSLFLAGLETA